MVTQNTDSNDFISSGVPGLDRDDSRLALMGLQANTVVPNGDTIAIFGQGPVGITATVRSAGSSRTAGHVSDAKECTAIREFECITVD